MDLREWQINEINRMHSINMERAKVLKEFLDNKKDFVTATCSACGQVKNNIAYYLTLSFSDYKAAMCHDCGYEDVKRMQMRPYVFNQNIKEGGENNEQ